MGILEKIRFSGRIAIVSVALTAGVLFACTACAREDGAAYADAKADETAYINEDENKLILDEDFKTGDGIQKSAEEDKDGETEEEETEKADKACEEETERDDKAYEEDTEKADKAFYISEISDEIFERMKGKSYKDNCTVERKELRYIHVLHKDINKVTHEGEMVCNVAIAEDLIDIFRELYKNDYPIERMVLVDNYNADDEASMTANNSSCFNYRLISNSNTVSKHGRGIAVDINPLYNPCVRKSGGGISVEPAAGAAYADRGADYPYKIVEGDLCYQLFREHGFDWGGNCWKNTKDYQHFELR